MAAADSQINHADAINYWESIEANDDGMLGGFSYISRVDIQGSKNFLGKLGLKGKALDRAVDCGAGIGRITKALLLSIATTVDIVEPVKKFSSALADQPGVGQIYSVGLEAWEPDSETRYDLIWNQWCLVHLTDHQLVGYFQKCSKVLSQDGWIIVKENMSTHAGNDMFDEVDSSVTRTDEKFREIFEKAGLKVLKTELAKGFPKGLYPVRLYALKPE